MTSQKVDNIFFEMVVMCCKATQIDNMARAKLNNVYMITCNGSDLFKNFYETVGDLNINYYNCPSGIAEKSLYVIF